jgi:hypothetical protein
VKHGPTTMHTQVKQFTAQSANDCAKGKIFDDEFRKVSFPKKLICFVLGMSKFLIYSPVGFACVALVAEGLERMVRSHQCMRYEQIKIIGGCDVFGKCGVGYENGQYGKADNPIIGQTVCVQYRGFSN